MEKTDTVSVTPMEWEDRTKIVSVAMENKSWLSYTLEVVDWDLLWLHINTYTHIYILYIYTHMQAYLFMDSK